MASGENVLWVVDRVRSDDGKVLKSFVFRSRAAANQYSWDKYHAQKLFAYIYKVKRATWGPEQ